MSFKQFLQRLSQDWASLSRQLWPAEPLPDDAGEAARRRGAIQQRMFALRFAIERLQQAIAEQEAACRLLEGSFDPGLALPDHVREVAQERERLAALKESLERKEDAYRRLQRRFHALPHA